MTGSAAGGCEPASAGATYAAAGVDLAAGEQAVERIRGVVRSTSRPEVLGEIGGFGGLFAFPVDRWRSPVLVSSTDGVGTKAMVATATGRYDTIGLDLVAMCVDDLVCTGAEPLLLLDYLSVGVLDPAQAEALVSGVAAGCRVAGCALVGGEMAEHPGAMAAGEFDLVGFALGVVERDDMVTGQHVAPGDVVIGLPSPGLRSNGYSLVRRVLLDAAGLPLDGPAWGGADRSLADELLEPSVIYAPAVVALCRAVDVRALAHITGGGLAANLARVLPSTVDAVLDRRRWAVPRIFGEVQRHGGVAQDEMERVFNLGIGMVAVVAPERVDEALSVLGANGHEAVEIGSLVAGNGAVLLEG